MVQVANVAAIMKRHGNQRIRRDVWRGPRRERPALRPPMQGIAIGAAIYEAMVASPLTGRIGMNPFSGVILGNDTIEMLPVRDAIIDLVEVRLKGPGAFVGLARPEPCAVFYGIEQDGQLVGLGKGKNHFVFRDGADGSLTLEAVSNPLTHLTITGNQYRVVYEKDIASRGGVALSDSIIALIKEY